VAEVAEYSAGAGHHSFTCIYSLQDNLIAPARSGALAGSQLHELRGLGHLELLRAPHVAERVVAALNQAWPA